MTAIIPKLTKSQEAMFEGIETIAEEDARRKSERPMMDRICKWMSDRGYATGHGDTIEEMLGEIEGQARRDGWCPISNAMENRLYILWAATDIAEDGRIRNWKMAVGSLHNPHGWNWDGRWLQPYDVKPTHFQLLPDPPYEIERDV